MQRGRGARSADTEPDGSRVCFNFGMPYLHLFYSRDSGWLRRSATDVLAIAIQESRTSYERSPPGSTTRVMTTITATTTTMIRLSADQRTYKIGSAVRWEWGARSVDNELDGSKSKTYNEIDAQPQLSEGEEDNMNSQVEHECSGDRQENARCGGNIRVAQNGHHSSTFSFFVEICYLRLCGSRLLDD